MYSPFCTSQAWANCKFHETKPVNPDNPQEWNLSWDCLSSYAVRSKLCQIQQEDLTFWATLVRSETDIPEETEEVAEDDMNDTKDDIYFDVVDVPMDQVLNHTAPSPLFHTQET